MMTDVDVHSRKLLAVLDVEMDAARQELDERRATGAVNFIETHKHAQGVPVSATQPTITVKGVRVV